LGFPNSERLRLTFCEETDHWFFTEERTRMIRTDIVRLSVTIETHGPARFASLLVRFLDRHPVGTRRADIVERTATTGEAASDTEVQRLAGHFALYPFKIQPHYGILIESFNPQIESIRNLFLSGYSTEFFDESTVKAAVGGCCHDFAIALHRMTGWPIACLWLDTRNDGFCINDEPSPRHVFCIAPDGRAVDVEGAASFEVLKGRYLRSSETDRCRVQVHGTEHDWELVARSNSNATTLMPRENGIQAASEIIQSSEPFSQLVNTFGHPTYLP
jgi:hypothetical protein